MFLRCSQPCLWHSQEFVSSLPTLEFNALSFVRWPQSSFVPVYGLELNFVFVYIVWWCCLSGGPSPVLCLYYNDFNLIYILIACGPRELEYKMNKMEIYRKPKIKAVCNLSTINWASCSLSTLSRADIIDSWHLLGRDKFTAVDFFCLTTSKLC